MKTILNIKYTLIISFVALLFTYGCDDAENSVMGNHIYLSNITTDNYQKISIEEDGSTTVAIQIRMADKATANTKVNIEISESALKSFNESHSTGYELLPSDFYTLDSTYTVITKGSASGSPINIKMKPLSPELNKTGFTYAVPVIIKSVEGNNVPIMDGAATFVYVITPIPYADVPVMKRANGMKMALKNESVTVNDFTIEFLVKIDNLKLNNNNQILFNAADHSGGDGGTGGEIFTRFAADGGAGKWDKFQIKNQGKSYDAQTSFKNDVWYHIACVNDNAAGTMSIYVNGVLDSKFPNAQISTTVNSSSKRGFRFCGENDNDSYMRSNVQASEIRFWTVARTEAQIKNNMYGVDAKSLGLFGYWKLNEGQGNSLADATGNGNDAVIFGAEATWQLNQKVEVGK